jgi:preprotein translocase subunit SecG
MKNLTIVVLFIFAALLLVYALVQHYDRKELQASVNLAQHVAENQFK